MLGCSTFTSREGWGSRTIRVFCKFGIAGFWSQNWIERSMVISYNPWQCAPFYDISDNLLSNFVKDLLKDSGPALSSVLVVICCSSLSIRNASATVSCTPRYLAILCSISGFNLLMKHLNLFLRKL